MFVGHVKVIQMWLSMKIKIFGLVTLNAFILHKLLKNKLVLFCHPHMKLEDLVLPSTW
jgi:hypothetical protein